MNKKPVENANKIINKIYNMMKVQKRNGSYENVSFDKIQTRLLTLCKESKLKPLNIDPTIVAQKVCSEIYDGVTTEELDILSSETSISLYSKNIEFNDYKEDTIAERDKGVCVEQYKCHVNMPETM